MQKVRWGILSTGYIANLFAEGLTAVDDAEMKAVGARSLSSAEAFGSAGVCPTGTGVTRRLLTIPTSM